MRSSVGALATIGDGVDVRDSTVEGAGGGLFACRRFSKGAFITEYEGERFVVGEERDGQVAYSGMCNSAKYAAAGCTVQTHVIAVGGVYVDGIREPD